MTTLFDEASRRELPSQPEIDDVRISAIKVGLGAIPVFGNALSESLALVLIGPLNRRRDEWFADLARRLRDLECKVDGFRFEDLANNEEFVSATLQATQGALRTHSAEKLEALRNAVLNVAANRDFSEEQQEIFLSLADSLQPVHLRILNFMDEPKGKLASVTLPNVLEAIRTHVPGAINFGLDCIRTLLEDLRRAGLTNVPTEQQAMAADRWT